MAVSLPPLFDNISDEDLGASSMEAAELVTQINSLRQKQLDGGGLSDDEIREGILLLVQLRRERAGKNAQNEMPAVVQTKLEDLF